MLLLQDDQVGLVRTVNNVSFDWLDEEKPKKRWVNKPLYALILTPTRELAIQVTNHIQAAAKHTGIHVSPETKYNV
jgi:ATP-dependent RNA helicase DDX24/MAK5